MSEELARIEAKIDQILKRLPAPEVVADITGPYGDPVVRKDPKGWEHETMVGKKYSECAADYLERLARLLDWMAAKDDESGKTFTKKDGTIVPSSGFARNDAAKARAWAKKNASKPF